MSDEKRETVSREGQPDVFYAKNADSAMNMAMEKARHTLRYFRESLLNPRPDQMAFSLKARIVDGNMVEHIWLNEMSFDDDGLYYGVVNNEPIDVKNVKLGARIGIAGEDVSDWLIVENGRLIGGYTIRAYRDGLPDDQVAGFDQSIGLYIDEGVDYYEHDMCTPEGAVLCLEDAYTAGDIEAAIACKDFLAEAKLLLAKYPGMGENAKFIEKTATALELSFRKFMMENGMPTFEGALRAFPEKEIIDEDTVSLTEICTHPDGRKTVDRLILIRKGEEWRVGPPANGEDQEEDEE